MLQSRLLRGNHLKTFSTGIKITRRLGCVLDIYKDILLNPEILFHREWVLVS